MTETLAEKTPEPENADVSDVSEAGIEDGKRASRKPHGKGFVYLSLRDADEAIRKIDHHAKRMTKDGLARALGHKQGASGRFFNKLEALKLFKLAEEDGDDVVLTPLAVDMLYGGSEAARTKARTTAFLSYEDFSKTFQEAPKGQDYELEFLVGYVKGKLGIVNEVERFKRLFLESAHFAGLLEGELNLSAKTIKLRQATAVPVNGDVAGTPATERKPEQAFDMVVGPQFEEVIASLGLTAYADRAEVGTRAAGKVKVAFEDGNVTFEVNRPLRVKIKNADLILDLPEMVKALRAKGFDV
jgi:hypothetical protein